MAISTSITPTCSSGSSTICELITRKYAEVARGPIHKTYSHLRGSHSTISDIFEKFFTEVMLKVYELIHQDYDLTDEYKHCITENMESIRPFASSSDHIVPQVCFDS